MGASPRWPATPGARAAWASACTATPEPGVIPCHRVVFADGSLAKGFAFGGEGVQRALLEAEGVAFLPDGRVDMANAGYRPNGISLARLNTAQRDGGGKLSPAVYSYVTPPMP